MPHVRTSPTRPRSSPRGLLLVVVVCGLLLVPGATVLTGAARVSDSNPSASVTTAASSTRLSAGALGPTVGPIRNYHFASAALPQWAGQPAWLAYDHGVQSYYIAESPSLVVVLAAANFTQMTTISVGSSPFGVAYDPTDNLVFVTNTGSANVTAISDFTNLTVGSVAVGASPVGVAFDNATDQIFVANSGSDTVSVVNASTLRLVTNVSVGSRPSGVAYDPVSRNVFVANNGSDNVTVISAATDKVVANPMAGSAPYAVAVDNRSGNVFVTNSGSGNVTVLDPSGTLQVATIGVGPGPAGLAFDSRNGTVWVDQGRIGVVVINATTNTVVQILNFDPQGATYDPDQNAICVTNSANNTFQCLVPNFWGMVSNVTFQETGLPNGTKWSVTANGFRTSSNASSIVFTLASGWYVGYSVDVISQYSANPSSGTFQTPWSGDLTVPINFSSAPGSYAVTFLESGLPIDGWSSWGVNVSNVSYQSDLVDFAIAETNGTYRYAPEPYYGFSTPAPSSFTVNGSDVRVVVPYAGIGYTVQFAESGLPTGIDWAVTFNGTRASSMTTNGVTDVLSFPGIPNGTYSYVIGPVPGWSESNVAASGSWPVSGRDVYIGMGYFLETNPPVYPVRFDEFGLPNGTTWTVRLGGIVGTTSLASLNFTEHNGTYPFEVSPVLGFTPTPATGSVTVAGAAAFVAVEFHANSSGGIVQFPVIFRSSGLPTGVPWSVDVDGSVLGTSGPVLTFWEPNGSHLYAVGPVSGYRESPNAGLFTVNGTSVSIAIAFASNVSTSPTVYTVGFAETGLRDGTAWSVDLGGVTRTSSTTQILFEEPNGTYSYLVFVGQGSSAPYGATLQVNGSALVLPLTFPLPSNPNGSTGGTGSSGTSVPPWYVDAGIAAAVILAVAALLVSLAVRGPARPRP